MESDWQERNLSDIVSLQRGHDLTESERTFGTVPVFGSAGQNGYHNIALAKGPGIVIGRSGASFGKVHFSPKDYWPHNTVLYVKDFKGNMPRFVYYLLKGIDFTVFNSGSAQPSLNRNYISSIKIKLPANPEKQQAIADCIGAFDDRIELLRETNRTLEDMARLLFRAWFVEFEPVRAKMAGRIPESCDAATAELFPSRLVDSELGEIPEGWGIYPVSNFVDVNAWTLSKKDRLDTIEYIEISEVFKGDVNKVQSYNRGSEPSRARRRLRHGDMVLSTVRPDRGAYFLCLNPPENLVASTGFTVLTPKEIPWSFIYSVMTQNNVSEYLGRYADGAAYPAINPEIIVKWGVASPSNEKLLNQFHALTSPFLERAERNRKLIKSLALTRDELLPKLLSATLEIPNDLMD